MHINPVKPNSSKSNTNFGAARVNICAIGDAHGHGSMLEPLLLRIEENKNQLFPDMTSAFTENIFAILGDYFFNPNLKGYKTSSSRTSGDVQVWHLNAFIDGLKKLIHTIEPYFVVGDHDLDAGDKFFFKLLRKSKISKILLSNGYVEASTKPNKTAQKAMNKAKIVSSDVLKIQDDKNPETKHKVLLLGLSPMGLDYYFPKPKNGPGLVRRFNVFDRFNHTEKQAKESELAETFATVSSIVRQFKEDNPNSPVVVLAHTGDKVVKMIADKVPIDVILSGHDHISAPDEGYKGLGGKLTTIVSLSQDVKLCKTLQLHLSDLGALDSVKVHTTVTDNGIPIDESRINAILERIKKYMREKKVDETVINGLEQNIFFADRNVTGERGAFASISQELAEDNIPLLHTEPPGVQLPNGNVRYGNSPLANTVTDLILSKIKEKEPDVQILGIASSAFRHSIADGATNIDLLNILSGSVESQSLIQTGKLTGRDLAEIIIENATDNVYKGSGFTLMQWSGIKIKVTKIAKMAGSKGVNVNNQGIRDQIIEQHFDEIGKYIQIKRPDGTYEPLDLKKVYKVALPNKCFIRSEVTSFRKFGGRFSSKKLGNRTLNELLFEYLNENNYKVKISEDKRVIV